jgi:hypothetical protein
MSDLRDRNGMTLAEAMKLLPPRVSDWEPANCIKLSAGRKWKMMNALHEEWKSCAICGRFEKYGVYIQIHHIARSDERCCLVPLCFSFNRGAECHSSVSTIGIARILGAKLAIDPEGTDFVRLALCLRRFLPDPILPVTESRT